MSLGTKSYRVNSFSSGLDVGKLRSEIGVSTIEQGILEIKDFATRIDILFEGTLNNDDQNTLQTIIDAHDGSVVSGFEYADDDGESQTTSTTYIEKLKLTTSDLIAGDYLITYCAEVTITSGFKTVDVICDLDDVDELGQKRFDSQDDVEYMSFSGFKKKTLSAGIHTIDIDYKSAGSPEVAKIRRARIYIRKL